MVPGSDRWDVGDASDWARVLGLVPVPLFGKASSVYHQSGNVLLDGQRSSFTFLMSDDATDLFSNRPLEWSWSSFLNHAIIADVKKEVVLLRRWDSPEAIRKFQLPNSPRGVTQLFNIVKSGKPVAHTDVILHLLRAFRAIRGAISGADNGHESLKVFNALILASKAVADKAIDRAEIGKRNNIGGIVSMLEGLKGGYIELLKASGALEIIGTTRSINSDILLSRFIDAETQFQYSLEPNLLMRHASGQLYQEAHLALERQPAQPSLFPGMDEADAATLPPARSDVRFTPVALARTLVQQALDALGDLAAFSFLDILDPACGSGVFLIQAILELVNRGYGGNVRIRGLDLSPISCTMANFCLEHASQDAIAAGMSVTYKVDAEDALKADWGHPDVVLMNPPFSHVDRMDKDQLDIVKAVLGKLDRGRSDKAMAFSWKAFESVKPGGVVSSVLPAPLLETSAGDRWRETLAKESRLSLLGCFRGYGYFKGTKVEPAFIVLKKPKGAPPPEQVTVVIATDGAEDSALRALRQDPEFVDRQDKSFEVYKAPAEFITEQPTWTPRSEGYRRAVEWLETLEIPTVGALFNVHQGALTGLNDAFLIGAETYDKFKPGEKDYFRPTAATSTIRNGKLSPKAYVFFPYGSNGLKLNTEDEVRTAVPTYYREILLPLKSKLLARARVDEEFWWKLTHEREWQREPSPKIVSAYFGQRGSFAYDDSGQYVVTQGYAWVWLREQSSSIEIEDPADLDSGLPTPVGFHDSPLPWAYLALLNSEVFGRFLSFACPVMQGGQLNLSSRYVSKVHIPDLSAESPSTKDMVKGLSRIGRAIHSGDDYDLERLNNLAARAYQMPLGEILSRDI
ncbi:HsdM family class I SAM-dependent methyltransferase [Singulisphaera rosea]